MVASITRHPLIWKKSIVFKIISYMHSKAMLPMLSSKRISPQLFCDVMSACSGLFINAFWGLLTQPSNAFCHCSRVVFTLQTWVISLSDTTSKFIITTLSAQIMECSIDRYLDLSTCTTACHNESLTKPRLVLSSPNSHILQKDGALMASRGGSSASTRAIMQVISSLLLTETE